MKNIPLPIVAAVAILTAAGAFWGLAKLSNTAQSPLDVAEEQKKSFPQPQPTGPQPKVVIADPGDTFDFGEMIYGDKMSHVFTIKNEGEGVLELKKSFTTCKCTLSDLEDTDVAPGDEIEVTLEWEPKSPAEEFGQQAYIKTNDPEKEQIVLNIKGKVLQDVIVKPAEGEWFISIVSEDTENPTKVPGGVASEWMEDFEVLSVETSHPSLKAEIRHPMTPEELESIGGKSGSVVYVTISPDMPVGRFSYPITIKTNSERTPEVKVEVAGSRTGPFSILGRGWMSAKTTFDLDTFEAAKGTSRKFTMIVPKFDEIVELKVAEATPNIVELSFEKDEKFNSPTNDKYTLIVSVPPGVQPGLYQEDGKRVKVKTTSNHPKFAEFQFDVAFRAN